MKLVWPVLYYKLHQGQKRNCLSNVPLLGKGFSRLRDECRFSHWVFLQHQAFGKSALKIPIKKLMKSWVEAPRYGLRFQGNIVKEENEDIKWFECKKLIITDEMTLQHESKPCNLFSHKYIDLHYVYHYTVLIEDRDDKTSPLELAEEQHSDLIAGKYEGGLKLWECTEDLLRYLIDNEKTISFQNLKVLDLGCGVGLLGIYAYLRGSFVTFQDYNKEIILEVTLPSFLFNIVKDQETALQQSQFYSGDWESFNSVLPDTETYDIILTSETIYNENNYKKLIDLFIKRLSKNGCVYLAAKTCYFGVGGGLRQFEKCLKSTEFLTSEVVWKTVGCLNREIIKIKRL